MNKINLRQDKEQTPLDEYKTFMQIHREEVEKIAHSIDQFINVDFSHQENNNDESLRFSLLIKTRLELILGRVVDFEELGGKISLMDNIVKEVCAKEGSNYNKLKYAERVKVFIKIWKLDELKEFTNEFLYYAEKLDNLREEEKRLTEENNNLRMALSESKMDDN